MEYVVTSVTERSVAEPPKVKAEAVIRLRVRRFDRESLRWFLPNGLCYYLRRESFTVAYAIVLHLVSLKSPLLIRGFRGNQEAGVSSKSSVYSLHMELLNILVSTIEHFAETSVKVLLQTLINPSRI
ncbi:hypothetical protein Rs2_14160 [Raphanus sativus]|nr:hypothetical protein Rs2_14160 [Raphanus sativus]